MSFICQALLNNCPVIRGCLLPFDECPISQMRWEGWGDLFPIWGESLAVDSVSEKKYWLLHRRHRGSKTFLCCSPRKLGLRMWPRNGPQGAVAWVWVCSMRHKGGRKIRHPFQWQQLWPCVWWWHFVSVPSSWTSGPECPAKEDCSSSTSFWFSAEFPSVILQLLLILAARNIPSVNSSFGWYSQSWCSFCNFYLNCNQKPWPVCEETDSSIRELAEGPQLASSNVLAEKSVLFPWFYASQRILKKGIKKRSEHGAQIGVAPENQQVYEHLP